MPLPWLPRRVRVAGDSMLPALRDGELFFVRTDPLALRRLRRGDIVVLRHPWDPPLKLVKRIRAVPGDRVSRDGAVRLPSDAGEVEDWWLRSDEYLVLSDNEAEGLDDGRRFGPIHRRLIEGRLVRAFKSDRRRPRQQ